LGIAARVRVDGIGNADRRRHAGAVDHHRKRSLNSSSKRRPRNQMLGHEPFADRAFCVREPVSHPGLSYATTAAGVDATTAQMGLGARARATSTGQAARSFNVPSR
jgi:hypothetical protein